MIRVASIGECMVELTKSENSTFQLAFAGDTYNTAVYLGRLGAGQTDVHFMTATGDDWLSEMLLDAAASEGVKTHALRVTDASPALYIVSTDQLGERSFAYFRDASPVRYLYADEHENAAAPDLQGFDLVYFSAITLQLLTSTARNRLIEVLKEARRRGATIAFDSNYRPRGWKSKSDAIQAIQLAMTVTDIALPSRADENLLHPGSTIDDIVRRYVDAGAPEVVVKDGPGTIHTYSSGARTEHITNQDSYPVDTTGAGDSFNAGYLHARLRNAHVSTAVQLGQLVAGIVISVPGAVIDRQEFGRKLSQSPGR